MNDTGTYVCQINLDQTVEKFFYLNVKREYKFENVYSTFVVAIYLNFNIIKSR